LVNFTNKTEIHFDRGAKDDWCVYFVKPTGKRSALRDQDYFEFFKNLSDTVSRELVLAHFTLVYYMTSTSFDRLVVQEILNFCNVYGDLEAEAVKHFIIIYAAMISEENVMRYPLKKRVKRIGFHQAVSLRWTASDAANYSRGRNPEDLQSLYSDYFEGAVVEYGTKDS